MHNMFVLGAVLTLLSWFALVAMAVGKRQAGWQFSQGITSLVIVVMVVGMCLLAVYVLLRLAMQVIAWRRGE